MNLYTKNAYRRYGTWVTQLVWDSLNSGVIDATEILAQELVRLLNVEVETFGWNI